MYVYIYAHTHMRMHIHIHVHLHTTYAYVYIYIYICAYTAKHCRLAHLMLDFHNPRGGSNAWNRVWGPIACQVFQEP